MTNKTNLNCLEEERIDKLSIMTIAYRSTFYLYCGFTLLEYQKEMYIFTGDQGGK
jgi:hypothetical protein